MSEKEEGCCHVDFPLFDKKIIKHHHGAVLLFFPHDTKIMKLAIHLRIAI
jgi:hypothetical protein